MKFQISFESWWWRIVCVCVFFFVWYVRMCVRLCLCFCFSGTHLLYNFIRNGCCTPMWMPTTTEYWNIPNKLNYFWKYVNSKKTVQWTCFLCVYVFVLACNFVFVCGFYLANGFELLNRNGDDVYTKRNDAHNWEYCHRKKWRGMEYLFNDLRIICQKNATFAPNEWIAFR